MSISFCDLLKSTRKDDAHLLRLVFRQALKGDGKIEFACNAARLCKIFQKRLDFVVKIQEAA
ncbi:MAG: hypothetical protein P0S95_03090 [Rhabdochlamydiaceae bacterium]|nr:hypothetical protein [Candidatus Amphrikana amoebophyrae]